MYVKLVRQGMFYKRYFYRMSITSNWLTILELRRQQKMRSSMTWGLTAAAAAAAAVVSLDLGSVGDSVRQIHIILFSGLGLIF